MKKTIEIGTEKKIAGLIWKILDVTEKGILCLGENLSRDMQFDTECNDWRLSGLRNYLNTEIYQKLVTEIGEENIIQLARDLMSLDGQREYGTCEDKVSLINVDEYRKYRNLIPNAGYWWWTITPDSTKCNDDTDCVAVVSPSGCIYCDNYFSSYGVRPICIFSPTIFESEDE